jgi:HEAT repeat protein
LDQIKQIAEQLSNPNRKIRYRAIYSLSKIDDPKAVRLLARTLNEDDDREIRAMAAKLLSTMGEEDSIPYLIAALKTDRYAEVRRAAAEALGNITPSSTDIEQALIDALYDRSKLVRKAIVQSLRLIESTDAIPALIGVMLGDTDGYIRYEAAQTLELLAPMAAIPAFIEALSADENSYVRYAAASALGQYGEASDSVDALVHALENDDNSYVRYAAGQALGLLLRDTEREDIFQRMLTGLNDSNTHVWHAIAESLWDLSDEALPMVIDALVSEKPELRQVALKAALWLSAEYDDEYAPTFDEEIDPTSWGWWN